MSERFYINCELGLGAVELDGPEAQHLAKVCRLRAGDAVCLFNGDGKEYRAVVENISRRSVVQLRVEEECAPERELPFRLEVAAPLPRGDRAQVLIEKLTELGATAFVPLRTARSVIDPREARLEKLERYVIEASKQCRRNVLMSIEPTLDWTDFVSRNRQLNRFVAHPGGQRFQGVSGAAVVAVGPEGGFAEEEIALARAASWTVVDLGPRILRVETAALALTSWLTLGR